MSLISSPLILAMECSQKNVSPASSLKGVNQTTMHPTIRPKHLTIIDHPLVKRAQQSHSCLVVAPLSFSDSLPSQI